MSVRINIMVRSPLVWVVSSSARSWVIVVTSLSLVGVLRRVISTALVMVLLLGMFPLEVTTMLGNWRRMVHSRLVEILVRLTLVTTLLWTEVSTS